MSYNLNIVRLTRGAERVGSGLEGLRPFLLMSTWTCFAGIPPASSQQFTSGGGTGAGIQNFSTSYNKLTAFLNDGVLFTNGNWTFPPINDALSNILISIDVASQIIQVYVNDVAATMTAGTWGSGTTININTGWVVDFALENPQPPGIGDHYIALPGSFVDLSITANRRFFIDGSGAPVDPLTSGAPSPVVFLSVPPGDPNANDFLHNYGSGPGPWTLLSGGSLAFDLHCSPAPPPSAFTFEALDLWFSPTPFFVDLTNIGNVNKFIDKNGCTVNLGPNGSNPFGYTPPVFLHVPQGGGADTWANNYGNGGQFILSGGDLTLAGNPPCCGQPPTGPLGPLQARLLMTDLHGEQSMVKWWTAKQESDLIFIGTQELNSVMVAWGTDGSFVFPMFQNNQSILPKTVQSKLWARPGGYMLQKFMTRLWMLLQYYQSSFPNVTISVDTEAGPGIGGAVITFQPASAPSGPPDVTVMPPQEVAQQGVLTGLTLTTIAGDMVVVSVSVQDQIAQYLG